MRPPAGAHEQDAVIEFLSRPGSYGLRDGEVERIETHCSIVFLAADRAYKLKRAIRYASLDYTTREARHAACKMELVLNRRTAPELYLRVESINRVSGGTLAFDGPGPALDHVVVMRRFAQSDLFDHMIEKCLLTRDLMCLLGQEIARLHATADQMPAFGGSDAIRRAIVDTERELARVATTLDGAAVGELGHHVRIALDANRALLDRRRAEGKVRRGHGDLRLANICLYAGRPTLFACIEFSDEINCIDVLYDLAFLLMDLHLRDRDDLANAVFNAYLDAAPETDGLRALPLFLALRAATRSYALAGSAGRRANPREAARLLALARRNIGAGIELLSPMPPRLVALGGDARFRSEMSAVLAGVIPPAPGARLLRLGASDATGWREAEGVLLAGHSVLVEADFAQDTERQRAFALASSHKIEFVGLWLGPLPAAVDDRPWRPIDTSQGVLTSVASAAELLTAAAPPRQAVAPNTS
jgi:uncharacterized protein